MYELIGVAVAVYRELLLFAAVGFLAGGVDELMIDLLWLRHRGWRTLNLPPGPDQDEVAGEPSNAGWLALFVPAWDEAGVIGSMLRATLAAVEGQRCRIFVGCYRNDPRTIAEVRAVNDERIVMIICPRDGPTTKADCLNMLWQALQQEANDSGRLFTAVILHDAEDLVSPGEAGAFARLSGAGRLIQFPVIPIVDRDSRWISGHYCDEFADAHGRTLPVRQAIGAAIPAAGVGCAVDMTLLAARAAANGGLPFDADSLTEDYELGLRLHEAGHATCFIRAVTGRNSELIATRAHFPATLEAAVRQKTRWISGIAIAGWDRLGWSSSWRDNWMRLRDRRTLLAALLLIAAYLALILGACLWVTQLLLGLDLRLTAAVAPWLIITNASLLGWRLAVRAACVTRLYGWREGLRSVPRAIVGNIVTILAVRRAILGYRNACRGQPLRWDKTSHKFPQLAQR